jgi:purine-binding chemotaxis protein CheW
MTNSGKINWPEIHERIEKARLRGEEASAENADEKRDILRNRARQLAAEAVAEPLDGRLEVLEFLLTHEKYAIATSYVREVFPLKDYTPVPGTPPFILGVINIRSRVVSVTDIRRFFDLPEKGITDLNKVLILQQDGMEFGILADAVSGIRQVVRSDIKPPPPTLSGVRSDYVFGVTSDRTVILDGGKLLSDPTLMVEEDGDA